MLRLELLQRVVGGLVEFKAAKSCRIRKYSVLDLLMIQNDVY